MEVVSTIRAGELLGVHSQTIARWVDKGVFPNAYRIADTGTIRIPIEDIEAAKQRPWLNKTENTP